MLLSTQELVAFVAIKALFRPSSVSLKGASNTQELVVFFAIKALLRLY
jgi:hypothetical protein